MSGRRRRASLKRKGHQSGGITGGQIMVTLVGLVASILESGATINAMFPMPLPEPPAPPKPTGSSAELVDPDEKPVSIRELGEGTK